jgi:hypothetical protein
VRQVPVCSTGHQNLCDRGLEQVNEGYRYLLAGKNVRGVVIHEG